MSCQLCTSAREEEFAAEINIHFSGLKNLDKPSVFVFPKILVCLDCGFSRFTTPEDALALLAEATPPSDALNREGSSNGKRGTATSRPNACPLT
jgi:hypothetical protein